ncbi:hypothetical protein [Flavobacterium sp.]|uniref:hypothetical protein n=1 Tax=Flavobacterium sp. TaxID=239 RepID=UPI002FD97F08
MYKKGIISLLLTLFLLASCQKQSNITSLDFIANGNKLEFLSNDGEYGEWGGNEKIVKVYSIKNHLFADYTERGIISKTNPQSKIRFSKKKISIGDSEKEMILESINELSFQKLTEKQTLSNSAVVNQVKSSDSSFVITIWPVVSEWKKYDAFCNALKKK